MIVLSRNILVTWKLRRGPLTATNLVNATLVRVYAPFVQDFDSFGVTVIQCFL